MKLFKSIDDKFEELGFKKVDQTKYGAYYEKEIADYKYVHQIDILHKQSGRHIVISSQKDINKDGFSNAVGLTKLEMKLCIKKMKEMGFN